MMPMAFVRGLMGPYMAPMPIGASLAMVFSLLVALTISPWLAMRLLKPKQHWREDMDGDGTLGGEGADSYSLHKTPIYRVYNKVVRPLIESPRKGVMALLIVAALTVASTLLFVTRTVQVKMLPFDNKSEFQVIIDTPEGTTLETTTQLAREIGDYLATVPEVTDYEIYSGIAAPVNFSGLVRHYMMRQGPNVADIQVNLVDKSQRSDQSHAMAKRVRGPIMEIAAPLRRRGEGGRGAAGTAGAVDPGGRGLRPHLRGPGRGRAPDQGDLRDHARRGGHRLVRRGRPDPLRAGRRHRPRRRARRQHPAGEHDPGRGPQRPRRRPGPHGRRRPSRCPSTCACRWPTAPAPRA